MTVAALPPGDPTRALPYAHGGPVGRGRIRVQPEDFAVEECLGYRPSGNGEHVFIRVQKRHLNTHDVAVLIARLAGVREVDVGYAGRKDKYAVATQAFSVRLPKAPEPDWEALQGENLSLLEVVRHDRKIRRGSLRGNRFRIRIRALQASRDRLRARFEQIAAAGVPNYFGSQRFGNTGRNLAQAALLFERRRRCNPNQRNIMLSAVRSWLFNTVVARRVLDGSWRQMLPGDVYQLAGTRRLFVPEDYDEAIVRRLQAADIHPTGPLAGRPSRVPEPRLATAALERAVLADFSYWMRGLMEAGLDAERRATRLLVQQLCWDVEADGLCVEFALEAGAYATVVLRELLDTDPG